MRNLSSGIAAKIVVLVAACLLVSLAAYGQGPAATTTPDKLMATNTNSVQPSRANPDERYRIGPGDILDIRILNRPNLSREAVRVEGNGVIRMPLIDDEIQAACKTEGELAKEIAEKYTKFYRKPQVDVFIKEYHSQQVAVIGAVNEQSRFELHRQIRLLELLTYAKGPSPKAGQTINVVHSTRSSLCKGAPVDEIEAFSSYRLSDTLRGEPKANPFLEAGDIITLPEADQVYVVGNVYTPVTIPLKEPITLSTAIAMAGGLKQDSKKDKVRVVRQEPGSQTKTEMIVDLSAIEKKKAEDLALLPNDIVDVPSSSGKALLRSILGGAGQSITQLPIRVIP